MQQMARQTNQMPNKKNYAMRQKDTGKDKRIPVRKNDDNCTTARPKQIGIKKKYDKQIKSNMKELILF